LETAATEVLGQQLSLFWLQHTGFPSCVGMRLNTFKGLKVVPKIKTKLLLNVTTASSAVWKSECQRVAVSDGEQAEAHFPSQG